MGVTEPAEGVGFNGIPAAWTPTIQLAKQSSPYVHSADIAVQAEQ